MSASWGARASQSCRVRLGDTRKPGVSVGLQFHTEVSCGPQARWSRAGSGEGNLEVVLSRDPFSETGVWADQWLLTGDLRASTGRVFLEDWCPLESTQY